MRSQCMGQGFESPHLHQNSETDLMSVFSFVYERGFAQLCCAQLRCVNPCRVRAGAYSLVQARSFRYYAYGYESPHLHQNLETDDKSVFSFAYMRGFAQRCCAQPCCMNPCQVRASAHSPVQARSFCYYAYGYESPHLHHKKKDKRKETACFFAFGAK